jgi:signal peptidase I
MNPQTREEARCSLAADTLRAWGELKLRATGVSMLPTLWPGDILTVQSYGLEQVEPGEVVLYKRRGRFFIHRVVRKSLTGGEVFLITRGDCMTEADPPVRSGEVLGRITEIQRAGSVYVPARKLSLFRRMLAFTLCHRSLFRRVGLRLWGRCHRADVHIEGALVEAAS